MYGLFQQHRLFKCNTTLLQTSFETVWCFDWYQMYEDICLMF